MSYEKVVKGATKIKMAAPKPKYIEPILQTTFNEHDNEVRSVMNALSSRLRDSAWTIVYKSLIVIHYMIRDGARDVALDYLSHNARIFENIKAQSNPQAVSMGKYSRYLHTRAVQYGKTGIDYARYQNKRGDGRLKDLSVEKGLLRECDSVYTQIEALLRCKFYEEDVVNNSVLLTAFRLLVNDLLSLYQVFNEGVINLLEHYFDMSKVDATHALDIYEGFTKQTANVVAFLKVAKHLEHATKLRVPNIKHAPTSLMQSLEDYLNDPDFEVNHRQYMAEKQARKNVDGTTLNPRPAAGATPRSGENSTSNQNPSNNEGANTFAPQSQADLIDLVSGGGIQMQESVIDGSQNTFQPQQAQGQPQQVQQVQPNSTGYNPFLQQTTQAQQQPSPQQLQTQQAQQFQPQQAQPFQAQPFQPQQAQQFQPQQSQQTQQGQYGNQLFGNQEAQQAPMQQSLTGGQSYTQPLQQNYTGAGFGGYTADPQQSQHLNQQPQQQQQPQVQLQRSNTGGNPFRVSMLGQQTGANPFKRQSTLPTLSETNTLASAQPQFQQSQPQFQQNQAQFQQNQPQFQQSQPQNQTQFQQTQQSSPSQQPQQTGSVQLQRTGTNPFSRQSSQTLTPQSTGGNPFRKSMFVQSTNSTGSGSNYNPTFGGLESLPTVSVFPQTQQTSNQQQQGGFQPQQQTQPQQNFLI